VSIKFAVLSTIDACDRHYLGAVLGLEVLVDGCASVIPRSDEQVCGSFD